MQYVWKKVWTCERCPGMPVGIAAGELVADPPAVVSPANGLWKIHRPTKQPGKRALALHLAEKWFIKWFIGRSKQRKASSGYVTVLEGVYFTPGRFCSE